MKSSKSQKNLKSQIPNLKKASKLKNPPGGEFIWFLAVAGQV